MTALKLRRTAADEHKLTGLDAKIECEKRQGDIQRRERPGEHEQNDGSLRKHSARLREARAGQNVVTAVQY